MQGSPVGQIEYQSRKPHFGFSELIFYDPNNRLQFFTTINNNLRIHKRLFWQTMNHQSLLRLLYFREEGSVKRVRYLALHKLSVR